MADIKTTVVLELDDKALKRDINTSLNGVGSTISSQSKKQGGQYSDGFGEGVRGLTGKLAGVVAGVGFFELGKQALLLNDNILRAEQNYTRMLGSAELAQDRVDDIIDQAKLTPLSQEELIKADQFLEGFGIRTESTFQGIIDASSATGTSVSDLGRILGQTSQSKSLENIYQLAERGIVTFDELKAAGIEFAGDGSIINSVEETYSTIDEIIQTKFKGAAEEASKTMTGQVSTAIDTVNISLGKMADQSGAYDLLANIVGEFNKLSNESPAIANGIIGIAIAVGLLTAALLVLGGPATAIIVGLGLLISGVALAWQKDTAGIKTQTEDLGKRINEIFGTVGIDMQTLQASGQLLLDFFVGFIGVIGGLFINFANFALNWAEGLKGIFSGLKMFLSGDFQNGTKEIFKGLAFVMLAPFEFATNSIIDLLNGLIDAYNRINDTFSGPDIAKAQKISVKTTLDSIQGFAGGGFPQGANAIIRTNEAGQEYVANARATSALQNFFDAVKGDFGGGGDIDNSQSYQQNNYGGQSNSGFPVPYGLT